MRKYIKALLLIISVTIFSGCENDMDSLKCSFKSNQNDYKIDTKYKIYYKDNIVKKVNINEVITSSKKDKLREFNNSFKSQYERNNRLYRGYKYKIKNNKDSLVLTINIDYTAFNMKKFIEDNEAMKEYVNKDNKLTLNGIIKMYESSGSVCKKK